MMYLMLPYMVSIQNTYDGLTELCVVYQKIGPEHKYMHDPIPNIIARNLKRISFTVTDDKYVERFIIALHHFMNIQQGILNLMLYVLY